VQIGRAAYWTATDLSGGTELPHKTQNSLYRSAREITMGARRLSRRGSTVIGPGSGWFTAEPVGPAEVPETKKTKRRIARDKRVDFPYDYGSSIAQRKRRPSIPQSLRAEIRKAGGLSHWLRHKSDFFRAIEDWRSVCSKHGKPFEPDWEFIKNVNSGHPR
jgi:hypothetical protein